MMGYMQTIMLTKRAVASSLFLGALLGLSHAKKTMILTRRRAAGSLLLGAVLGATPVCLAQSAFSCMTSDGVEHPLAQTTLDALYDREHEQLAKGHYFHGLKPDFVAHDGAVPVTLTTDDGYVITGYYIDRGSDTMIVVGPGAWCSATSLRQFVHLTEGYDLFLCTFRWYPMAAYLARKGHAIKPYKSVFFDTINDVTAILRWVHTHKNYKQVIGLGQSYSAWLFLMAQARMQQEECPWAFSKLILDGCGLSLHAYIAETTTNPWLMWTGGRGDSPKAVAWVLNRKLINKVVRMCMQSLFRDIHIGDYLEQITHTPILFIQGRGDKLAHERCFNELFAAAHDNPRIALLSPHGHILHSMRAKEVYRAVLKAFVEQPDVEEVARLLTALPGSEHGLLNTSDIFTDELTVLADA